MPRLESYEAEVTVSVALRGNGVVVGSYSVTRKATGQSAPNGETMPAANMTRIVDEAVVRVTTAHRLLEAGLQKAEARRLA